MHQKWHNAYEETIDVPFVFSQPLCFRAGGARDVPTNHANLLHHVARARWHQSRRGAQARCRQPHRSAPSGGSRPLGVIRGPRRPSSESVLFTTDDEIRSRQREAGQPIAARRPASWECTLKLSCRTHIETVIAKVDVDGEDHVVKLSRYHDNPQFWKIWAAR